MKLDSFTTARCNKCGWVKQFQPGKEYESKEFICKCTETKKDTSNRDEIIALLKSKGVKVAHNISDKNLDKKWKEVQSGDRC